LSTLFFNAQSAIQFTSQQVCDIAKDDLEVKLFLSQQMVCLQCQFQKRVSQIGSHQVQVLLLLACDADDLALGKLPTEELFDVGLVPLLDRDQKVGLVRLGNLESRSVLLQKVVVDRSEPSRPCFVANECL